MLHRFLAAYVRYATHVVAYLSAGRRTRTRASPGGPAATRSTSRSTRPQPQNRWVTGFRFFLALPAIVLADTLLGFGTTRSRAAATSRPAESSATVAFLGWFAASRAAACRRASATCRLRDRLLGAGQRLPVLLLTDRYPNSDPACYESRERLPQRPDPADGRRRPAALAPHDVLPPAARDPALRVARCSGGSPPSSRLIANWFATLFRGTLAAGPAPLPRRVPALPDPRLRVPAARRRIRSRASPGRPGTYPVDVEIDPPERQNRWMTGSGCSSRSRRS